MNGPQSTSKDVADITSIIPPKLIRNYDVYIVLKPKNSETNDENNLIDFETDTAPQLSEVTPKIEDSKKELSVIDLFENVAVDSLNFQNKTVEDVIFDPLEFKNIDETTKSHDLNDKYAVLTDLDNAYVSTGLAANCDIKNFDDIEDFTFPKLDRTHEADEDLIDEVLSTNIQRLAINNDKYGFNHYKNSFSSNSQDKSAYKHVSNNDKTNFDIPKIIRTERQCSLTPEIERTNLGAIPKNKTEMKSQLSLPNFTRKGVDFSVPPKTCNVESIIPPKSTSKVEKHYLPIQIFDKPQSPDDIRRYVDKLLKSKTKYCNVFKYYNPKDFYTQANEIEFVVETMKLDQKKYRQRRITVEDSVVATYSLAPNFDEKKTVLPQIMDRLLNKKTRLDKFINCKPKLILDCGSFKKKDIPVKFDPVVLTDNCNKERLRNLLLRQSFNNFLMAGPDGAE